MASARTYGKYIISQALTDRAKCGECNQHIEEGSINVLHAGKHIHYNCFELPHVSVLDVDYTANPAYYNGLGPHSYHLFSFDPKFPDDLREQCSLFIREGEAGTKPPAFRPPEAPEFLPSDVDKQVLSVMLSLRDIGQSKGGICPDAILKWFMDHPTPLKIADSAILQIALGRLVDGHLIHSVRSKSVIAMGGACADHYHYQMNHQAFVMLGYPRAPVIGKTFEVAGAEPVITPMEE